MWDTLRDSSIGQLARLFYRPEFLSYPEELGSFELPEHLQAYSLGRELERQLEKQTAACPSDEGSFLTASTTFKQDLEADRPPTGELIWSSPSETVNGSGLNSTPISTPPPGNDALQHDLDKRYFVLVDWYDRDSQNPRNWSLTKKLWITVQMGLYTFAVYIGTSLYAPSEEQIMTIFHTGFSVSLLGIALYVIGYGIGPLLWSPLSEIPSIGRTSIYITTLFVFVLLALAASLVDNLPGLLALRFLLGFFGSPCLATAGATLDDMFAPWKLPYVFPVWSTSSTLAPALGPIISGFAVNGRLGWRVSQWELFWITAPIWVIMFVSLPETNADTLLHWRAARLRAQTGRSELICEADIKRKHMSARQIIINALLKPWQINALDPAVLYTTVYAAVLYGTYYSFFESFPLVFTDMYGFSLGESGLPFLAFVPALMIAVPGYIRWFRLEGEMEMRKNPPPLYGYPESRLLPSVWTTFLGPIGLFIFAWTSRPDIHWIIPVLGLLANFICIFVAFQCMMFYISRCYPKYSASLFAANGFARSSFAAGSILFSKPMYERIGIDWGVSLLGGLSILCSGGMIFLYYFGDRLRARSRFAQSD
ncbi:MFS general substrate transporter [Xylariaceae sp. FL0662B]|nr:MFS general substrate transporter [Xylariaceae sp. FL0662B]